MSTTTKKPKKAAAAPPPPKARSKTKPAPTPKRVAAALILRAFEYAKALDAQAVAHLADTRVSEEKLGKVHAMFDKMTRTFAERMVKACAARPAPAARARDDADEDDAPPAKKPKKKGGRA